MTARDGLRVPFGLAVAMAGQPVSLVDECLDEYEAAHRAEVLREAADLLESLHGDNEHLARDWDWRDAATIPASCATLLRRIADGSAT